MKKLKSNSSILKIVVRVLIAVTVQVITYRWRLHTYLDSFLFVWTMLFLGLFLMEIFKVDTGKLSMIRYKPTNPDVKSVKSVTEYGNNIMVPSMAIALFIMFIMNLIGFLIFIRT